MSALTKEDIARRVEETLRNAAYLEMNGVLRQSVIYGRPTNVCGGLEPVEFHSRMARDRLHCEVFKDGQLDTAFAWLNGRVQEYKRGEPLIEYESPRPDGLESTRLNPGFGCLFGTQTRTWVGPLSDRGPKFRERIEASEQLPDQEVGGRICYVFKLALTTCATEPLEHTHYVDRETCLIRRWDSLHQGIHRVRLYEPEVVDHVPAQVRWRITVSSSE